MGLEERRGGTDSGDLEYRSLRQNDTEKVLGSVQNRTELGRGWSEDRERTKCKLRKKEKISDLLLVT